MFNYATNQIHYHGIRVPASTVIGQVGKGFRYVIDGWNAKPSLLAAEAIGGPPRSGWNSCKSRPPPRESL
jgi:acyl-CoA dehydrogenase